MRTALDRLYSLGLVLAAICMTIAALAIALSLGVAANPAAAHHPTDPATDGETQDHDDRDAQQQD